MSDDYGDDFNFLLDHIEPSQVKWVHGFLYESQGLTNESKNMYSMKYVAPTTDFSADTRSVGRIRISRAGRPIKYRNKIKLQNNTTDSLTCTYCDNKDREEFVTDTYIICKQCGTCIDAPLFQSSFNHTECTVYVKPARDVHDHGYTVANNPDDDPVYNMEYQQSIGTFSRRRYFMKFLLTRNRNRSSKELPSMSSKEMDRVCEEFDVIEGMYRKRKHCQQFNYGLLLYFILSRLDMNIHLSKARIPMNKKNALLQLADLEDVYNSQLKCA